MGPGEIRVWLLASTTILAGVVGSQPLHHGLEFLWVQYCRRAPHVPLNPYATRMGRSLVEAENEIRAAISVS